MTDNNISLLTGKPIDPPAAPLNPAGDTTVVQTAPATATTITKSADWRDNAPLVLMLLVTCGFFGDVAVMLFHEIPPGNLNVANTLTGSIATAWVTAMSYWFGSTAGSKTKDATISQLATTKGPSP
jgi:hypothetical protein